MSLRPSDQWIHHIFKWASWVSTLLVVSIIAFVALEAFPAISLGPLKFLMDPLWDPSKEAYLLLPMIVGSFAVTLGALAIALPLGVSSALFYEVLAPQWLAKAFRAIVEILAGIPSVIFGFWGLVAVVPILYHLSPPGANILAGSLVLGLMILPTISLFIANGIKGIPKEQFIHSKALGLSQYTQVMRVIFPSIKGSFISGTLLALGRAIGETMAVLMVCGNIAKFPQNIFDPVRTLTSNIALEMAYALNEHRAALFLSGLILLSLVTLLTVLAQPSLWRERH